MWLINLVVPVLLAATFPSSCVGNAIARVTSSPQNATALLNAIERRSKRARDLEMQESLNANWVEMLAPIPSSIYLINELGLLAAGSRDFSLRRPANGPFQVLRHTESFKACLLQVGNTGVDAFTTAHHAMRIINWNTEDMKEALIQINKLVFANDVPKDVVVAFLPRYIDSIKRSIKVCKKKAETTTKKFKDMAVIVAELLEGATSSQASSHNKKVNLTLISGLKKEQEVTIQSQISKLQSRLRSTEAEKEQWRRRFEAAYDTMPKNGWETLLMKLAESAVEILSEVSSRAMDNGEYITETVRDVVSYGGQLVNHFGGGAVLPPLPKNTHSKKPLYKKPRLKFGVCVLGADGSPVGNYPVFHREFSSDEMKALTLLGGRTSLQDVLEKYRQDMVSDVNQDDISQDHHLGESAKGMMQLLKAQFSSSNVQDDIKEPVLYLLRLWDATVNQISNIQTSGDRSGKVKKFKESIDNYISAAACLKGMASEILNLPLLEPSSKTDVAAKEHSTATSESIVTQHLSLARRKLIEAESRLKSLETKHEKLVNKNLDLTKDLAKIMTDIQRIANEAETVDAVLDVLEKALVTLAELANQWTKLTEFFVLVEDHIENLDIQLNETFTIMHTGTNHRGDIVNHLMEREFLKSYSKIKVLNRVSSNYLIFSRRHIIDAIAKHATMVVCTGQKCENLRLEIVSESNESQKYLEKLMQQESNEFTKAVQSRQRDIRDVVNQLSDLDGVRAGVTDDFAKGVHQADLPPEDEDNPLEDTIRAWADDSDDDLDG